MAVGCVADVRIPASDREMISIARLDESPISINASALPNTPSSRIFLRPNRSDSVPQIGAKMNREMLNDAISSPSPLPLAPKLST